MVLTYQEQSYGNDCIIYRTYIFLTKPKPFVLLIETNSQTDDIDKEQFNQPSGLLPTKVNNWFTEGHYE